MSDAALSKTPLHAEHVALGARMVPFAGWSMPVQYAGVVKEHHAVRTAAGLFDVSHMGELRLRGPSALAVVDSVVTNDIAALKVGRAKYTVAVNEAGGILDDLIVYRLADEDVLVVCNASNVGKMSAHFAQHATGRCDFEDQSPATALIALQGPRALAVARDAGAPDAILALPRFAIGTAALAGVEVTFARTGYTGEDGFELFCANEGATTLWRHLLAAGAAHGIAPTGLGARDTLRLEAALSLYGNDIDETTNPFEAGLGWVVKLDRGDFVGREALRAIHAAGPARRLVGLEMTERGIARHGYPIVSASGAPIGVVTSGSPGPTIDKNVALGYVPTEHAAPGTTLGVEIRGKIVGAAVVKTPFYARQ
ncbi:MAG: glycine cleavage system aminomethyltransferase GcvT [Sandaracinaceae bacterium]|nr:glycine cleavage system aminomethyltransferase GcvT [Sandaracinaceae bacterium]